MSGEMKKTQVDEAVAGATSATMARTHWMHHVTLNAIRNGVDADWLKSNHAGRMVVWFNAGEAVRGAVEMLVFWWRQWRVAERAERETDYLKAFVRKAVVS